MWIARPIYPNNGPDQQPTSEASRLDTAMMVPAVSARWRCVPFSLTTGEFRPRASAAE